MGTNPIVTQWFGVMVSTSRWGIISWLNPPGGVFTDLLHEHVDVRLRCVQDVSVWVLQAVNGDFHRLSVDVDPPRCAACKEAPEITRFVETQNKMAQIFVEENELSNNCGWKKKSLLETIRNTKTFSL